MRSEAASRHPLRALCAIAMALAVLHVTAAILRDLPLWDEANYLRWGTHFLIDGAPLSLAQSPAYALLLGVLSFVFGPANATRIAAIGGTLAFGAAVGSIAFVVWRTSTARWLATAVALGSAHSFSVIGVHRASITLLLVGSVVLAAWRPRIGLVGFLLAALGAYFIRPEAAWAVPFLPLAIWRLAPSSRPSPRNHRLAYVAGLTGLVIAGTMLAAHDGMGRNWLAFRQHYALYRQPQLSAVLGASFSPWLDFDKVMAMDFPGARSPVGALHTAPTLVLRFVLANAKAAVTLAFGSMAASPRAGPVVLAISAATGALAFYARAGTHTEWRGLAWFMCAMGATSASAVEVVSDGRHVIGLSVALAFGLGLVASSLAGRRTGRVVPVIVAGVSLLLACTHTYEQIRRDAVIEYPAANMIAAVHGASHGRPFAVAGMCNSCICAYASNCMEIGPAQGYTSATQCELLDGPADIVVLRIEAGAAAAAPCRANGRPMLGRWPAIGMEVWGRRSNPSAVESSLLEPTDALFDTKAHNPLGCCPVPHQIHCEGTDESEEHNLPLVRQGRSRGRALLRRYLPEQ